MKRRIIRGPSSITAADDVAVSEKKYPESYIKLQKSIQNLRHLIDETVDDRLEGYALWDSIQASLLDGIQAIASCCEDMQSGIISSTGGNNRTYIRADLDDKYPKVIQVDGKFYEVEDSDFRKCVVIPEHKFNKDELGPAFDVIENYSLDSGTDELGSHYIDIQIAIKDVPDAEFEVLKAAEIYADSHDFDVVLLCHMN